MYRVINYKCIQSSFLKISRIRHFRTSTQVLLSYNTDPIDPYEEKFSKVLIANRGEIACRIIKTCKLMEIKTVAVYSIADSMALHVKMADEAYCVGPAPSNLSYLNMDAILEAVFKSHADAVHPGYGFLSENREFAKKLSDAGIAFIGPNSYAIQAMGDKIESKRIAKEAGVNIIPGFDGVVETPEDCVKIAQDIGYPVMIKASAGGGGKGMRIAWNDSEAMEGFRFSKQEASSSFGDDRLLVEKFVDQPRHIEVQVLCDKHGNAIHLNERECSIQRRNQKVIEEAPSTFVTPEMREAMGNQALSLAKAVGYDSAGTVEFLVDSQRNFYFLEMNTRLQVEHPITECITGIDVVHQMVRIAKGHPLKLKQKDVPLNGWAIESRVYAEDPYKNFGLPSIGRLYKYIEPLYSEEIRCDSGIKEGTEISIYYDPMICKLITYGQTRQEAIDRMVKALDLYVIRGVTHNIPLLRDIMTEASFLSGNLTTKYLYQTYPEGFKGRIISEKEKVHLIALAASLFVKDYLRARDFVGTKDKLTVGPSSEWSLCVKLGKEEFHPTVLIKDNDTYKITMEEREPLELRGKIAFSSPTITIDIDGNEYHTQLLANDHCGALRIGFLGTQFTVKVMTDITAEYSQLMPEKPEVDVSKMVKAPMPGVVKSINVAPGDMVIEGQEVLVLEAMKMQNSLAASGSGKIKAVNCKNGDTVEEEQVLVEFE